MKPSLWQVKLSEGYSDCNENRLFFSGNDENEIWDFLCRYIDNQDYEHDLISSETPLAMKWGNKTYKHRILLDEDYPYTLSNKRRLKGEPQPTGIYY